KHEALDAAGDPLANTHLALWQHKPELDWDHYWDKQHHWRTTTTLGFDVNTDNGQGFFDYRAYRTSEQICCQIGAVTMKGKAAVAYYDYPIRTTGVAGTPPLHRTLLTLDLRAEKQLTKFLKAFGEYEYEQALSNERDEQYRVNTVRGGLEWEF
ncbi:MAG: hypothetical protein NTW03_07150, partial [Verrucomicrobia bacterium]|nr:hypothetical protein [Verrucomicrobiota bacterium]